MTKSTYFDMGLFFEVGGRYAVMNFVDFEKMEGAFVFFDTPSERETYWHDTHVRLWAHLHPKDCPRCEETHE